MRFKLQSNSKGKTHLINDDTLYPLCGGDGGDFFSHYQLEINDQGIFEFSPGIPSSIHLGADSEIKLSDLMIDTVYCKRCLKKAKKML